jgi:hypothetical protein
VKRTRRITRALLARWPLPALDPDGGKVSRGTLLVAGGSDSVSGAVTLAGLGGLRADSGGERLKAAVCHGHRSADRGKLYVGLIREAERIGDRPVVNSLRGPITPRRIVHVPHAHVEGRNCLVAVESAVVIHDNVGFVHPRALDVSPLQLITSLDVSYRCYAVVGFGIRRADVHVVSAGCRRDRDGLRVRLVVVVRDRERRGPMLEVRP